MESKFPSNSSSLVSLDIEEPNKYSFKLEFKIDEDKIIILAIGKISVLSPKYKLEFSLEDFYKLDNYFKRYTSLSELFECFSDIEISKSMKIELEDNFIKLIINFPTGFFKNPFKSISFMLPKIESKESDIILKLCEKANEIDVLKEKVDFLFDYLDVDDKELELYKQCKKDFKRYKQTFISTLNFKEIKSKSDIIEKYLDLIIPLEGICENLNKKIKGIKLLFKASKDGDTRRDFYAKCDKKKNTLTFIKSANGKRFGGFTSVAWVQNTQWIKDENAFVFSVDKKKCYFYKNNDEGSIIGYSNHYDTYMLCFGKYTGSNDILLNSRCLSTNNNQSLCVSNIYDGEQFALNGERYFQAIEVETYQITLE